MVVTLNVTIIAEASIFLFLTVTRWNLTKQDPENLPSSDEIQSFLLKDT